MKENIKNFKKITLATLALGASLAPIQTAISHSDIDLADIQGGTAKIQIEHHPHPPDPGSLNDHYVDPRSIRAVGYDSGKSDKQKDNRENWDFYNRRMA
jgi:hypothetical protein